MLVNSELISMEFSVYGMSPTECKNQLEEGRPDSTSWQETMLKRDRKGMKEKETGYFSRSGD